MLKREELSAERIEQIVADARKAGYDFFLSQEEREASLKEALTRYAQKVAVAQRRPVFVVDNAGAIAVCYDAGCASAVADPGGSGGLAASLPSGVAYAFSAGTFHFDGLGRPSPNAAHTITITASGEPARVVAIEAETGYVHQ